MAVETTFSMMSVVWGSKEMRHRAWDGLEAHLAYTIAAFDILTQWNGLEPDANGGTHRSIALFTLRHLLAPIVQNLPRTHELS